MSKLVLIDDDPLMHQSWQWMAEHKGIEIDTFFGPQEFLNQQPTDKTTAIFIDLHLGDFTNGMDVARSLHKQGYSRLYLCTGMGKLSEPLPSFFSGLVGKGFPDKKLLAF